MFRKNNNNFYIKRGPELIPALFHGLFFVVHKLFISNQRKLNLKIIF